jgi:hypothetical protein
MSAVDTSHVVLNLSTNSIVCKHCGAVEKIAAPLEEKAEKLKRKLTPIGRSFLDRHRFCRKGKNVQQTPKRSSSHAGANVRSSRR